MSVHLVASHVTHRCAVWADLPLATSYGISVSEMTNFEATAPRSGHFKGIFRTAQLHAFHLPSSEPTITLSIDTKSNL